MEKIFLSMKNFRATVWIVVMVSSGEPLERIRMMLGTLLLAYHYTGYQVVQAFDIYYQPVLDQWKAKYLTRDR